MAASGKADRSSRKVSRRETPVRYYTHLPFSSFLFSLDTFVEMHKLI
jgi:hypothetical protein